MSDYIGNDIIDTRDLIKELEEMKREREGLEEALEEAKEALADLEADEDATEEDLQCAREAVETAENDLEDFDEDEYKELKEFCEDLENSISDYHYGETLIEEGYFTQYAQDLAEDLGYISRDVHWPYTCIDWEAAAYELKQDYTTFKVGGYTYYAIA